MTPVAHREFIYLDLRDREVGYQFLMDDEHLEEAFDNFFCDPWAFMVKDWSKSCLPKDVFNYPNDKRTVVCVSMVQDLSKKKTIEDEGDPSSLTGYVW